jgi:signal transduction histidine kinase
MPAVPQPLLPRRPRLPRRTVRLRMTLLYGSLFFASGAALLAVTYVLVLRANRAPFPGQPAVPGPVVITGQLPAGAPRPRPTVELTDLMHRLAVSSALALAAMSVVSIVLGWLVAGRLLRPLRTITATVRDISATNLHRRLTMRGPNDELKELGDTFDDLLRRLEAAFAAQRQFVANASHELRTPLARQRAIGQVALSDPEATVASLRAAHERVVAAGEQQERLIEALLTLTRGQAGLDVRGAFDLGEVTREVVAARLAEAQLREVSVRVDIRPAPVLGHRNLAERLTANLVDNAVRHNVPGGWVEVATDTRAGRATVTVTNTGPLVPADAVDDVFQPFRRLGEGRAAPTGGLGLGLSIVRAVADAHGASLRPVARPGGGMTITVTFPAVDGHGRPPAARPELVAGRSCSVH